VKLLIRESEKLSARAKNARRACTRNHGMMRFAADRDLYYCCTDSAFAPEQEVSGALIRSGRT
jgi:hypothetical protein